ncbi:MAG: hypothetical protein ACOX60_03135 [Massiliimalia sp.]|jgi:hypothetical protein
MAMTGKKRRMVSLMVGVFVFLGICTGVSLQVDALFRPKVDARPYLQGTLQEERQIEATAAGDGTLCWQLSLEELGFAPKTITLQYRQKTDAGWTEFSGEGLIQEGDQWSVPVPEGLDSSSPVWIRVCLESEEYPALVPKTAVVPKGKEYVVRSVMERNGLFEKEQYLLDMPVEVLAEDSVYAAVDKAYFGNDVVFYSDRPVFDGMTVSVVRE